MVEGEDFALTAGPVAAAAGAGAGGSDEGALGMTIRLMERVVQARWGGFIGVESARIVWVLSG